MNLKFAMLNNNLVHIDEVSNGLNCGCVCPQCGEDLVAKNNGMIKEHHFAHYSGSECEHGYETMLHLLAKKVIEDHRKILIPELRATIGGEVTSFQISGEQITEFKRVALEKKIADIVPDVIVYDENEEPLLIEIKVTHGIDDEKLEKIKKIDINTIEVDLSQVEINSYEEILSVLTNNHELIRWIYNKDAEEIGRKLIECSEELPIVKRGLAIHVDDCPIESRNWKENVYENVIDDCLGCEFNLLDHNIQNAIYCLGKCKLKNFVDLSNINKINKVGGKIESIEYTNGDIVEFKNQYENRHNIFELWRLNEGKPFLARNNESGVAVYIGRDPNEQYNIYKRCYGIFYKNGHNIGSRKIYGAFDKQWSIIKRD